MSKKAASPVRLDKNLMSAATVASKANHRSAAEQVEHWASIGRMVSENLSPNALVAIAAGIARIDVSIPDAPPVSMEDVMAYSQTLRESGTLPEKITSAPVRYQASTRYPGLLERMQGDAVDVGTFENGVFTVKEVAAESAPNKEDKPNDCLRDGSVGSEVQPRKRFLPRTELPFLDVNTGEEVSLAGCLQDLQVVGTRVEKAVFGHLPSRKGRKKKKSQREETIKPSGHDPLGYNT